jgi:hypothetical protein
MTDMITMPDDGVRVIDFVFCSENFKVAVDIIFK